MYISNSLDKGNYIGSGIGLQLNGELFPKIDRTYAVATQRHL